jgi:putative hydrolase of the HAD superfamily
MSSPIFLFDLDDTLLDHRTANAYRMPRIYADFQEHIRHGEQEFYAAWRTAEPLYYKLFLDGKLTFEQQRAERIRSAFGDWDLSAGVVKAAVAALDKYYREGWRPFADTTATLQKLAGFRKGIITNGSIRQQQEKIDVLGIVAHFELILISEEVGTAKPNPAIFELACARLGCEPAECVFVGDSWENDVVGSHAAGMKPVWINRDDTALPEFPGQVPVVRELGEVADLFKQEYALK